MFKQSAQHVASYYAQTYPAPIPLRPTPVSYTHLTLPTKA